MKLTAGIVPNRWLHVIVKQIVITLGDTRVVLCLLYELLYNDILWKVWFHQQEFSVLECPTRNPRLLFSLEPKESFCVSFRVERTCCVATSQSVILTSSNSIHNRRVAFKNYLNGNLLELNIFIVS